jgi:hypothetical protein
MINSRRESRSFDVKHHAAHGTILINFGSEKRSYVFLFPGACGRLRPLFPHRALDPVGPLSPDPSLMSASFIFSNYSYIPVTEEE